MNNGVYFCKVLFMGELLIIISALPHFFIRRLPPKFIGFGCILFSVIWFFVSIYIVFFRRL